MKLAEKCGTAASYIGEIEIGRKFPSVEMIERTDTEALLIISAENNAILKRADRSITPQIIN
ncbi:MAG: hypothetical protein Ta2B_30820 [Termitinemataceae bacterium]|nr:MAG: hypothetical protein Ta2B_30820 [Termitinemataceae bacterium]